MIELKPIGVVRGGRPEPIDDDWGRVEADIVLDASAFSADATAGLTDFSHLTVVYQFHLVADGEIERGARHPRGRTDWPKVGIFAQRGKGRPNRIGVTTCEIIAVDGLVVHVRGLDAIDGTPVLDIKPHMTGWATWQRTRAGLGERDHASVLVGHWNHDP